MENSNFQIPPSIEGGIWKFWKKCVDRGGIWTTLIFKYPPRSRGVFGNFGKSASIEGGIWKILSKHASIDEVFDLNELKPVVGVWCWEWYNSIKPPEA